MSIVKQRSLLSTQRALTDLSTAIELLKERHEQGHKQAFMVLSADAIYAGKVKLVPECINGSIIGAVDKHGSKSVYDIEDDLACLDKRVHCLIESLAWKRITDIYHAKEPENAEHNLKLALNYLRRYRTELVDAVIPDAKQSVKLLEKKVQAKSRTISTATTIPGVEDETGGRDECSSGGESDCEEDNLSIHTGPNDENLRGSMLAEQLKAINHQKTKSVAILMEKLAIWNGFLKNATETSSTLTELVAQLYSAFDCCLYILVAVDQVISWCSVKARKLPWNCLPAYGNRQVSPEMEELIEWCGHQNPSLHKTQWKSQLTNLARDCGSFFLDLQQVQTGANSEFVSALLVLKGKLKLDSKFITRSPLSTFLADAHFHILETINLTKNCKTLVSRTSLNVELYYPIPHPLKATKKLFINPDYDHLICKNFIPCACDSNFMDMRSGLQCIFEAGWFARDPMDVKLGHEAFLPETAEQLRAKGFHDAAKVSKIIGDFYDALDCRGISDQERIASARKVVSWIHEVFGADLRKDPCRGKYSGLPWQVILPLLVLALNFILLCEEVVAESIGQTTETTVAKLFQHFNWSRVADSGVIQDFLIDESLSSTFVVGLLNNANNTYISKGSTSKLGEWNVQIEKEHPVPSFLKKHLLPIPQCIQTPNPYGVVPPLPNILLESSNVVNIPHVRALAIAYSHNVSVSAPPSESQKRKATDANVFSKSRRKILGNSNK
ncbi:hypothetical protein BDR26DRAFT_1005554 [Obelidium mucronatum]|nr:hypothetical protein BDR26DRAFT_1005554 [Obelidium mucronatum]